MFAAAVLFTALPGSAIGQTPAEAPIFGPELMTQQERLEYRDRVRAAGTQEEREQIRNQHHEPMQTRAKERGAALPVVPPMRGGMGPGTGQGPGMPRR